MNEWQSDNAYTQGRTHQNNYSNTFSMLALTLGIIAVISLPTLISPIFFGSLSLIFAILSRTDRKEFSHSARIGMIVASGSLLISIVLITTFIYKFQTDEEWRLTIDNQFKESVGITMEEYWYLTKSLYDNGELPPIPEDSSPEFVEYYHMLEKQINGSLANDFDINNLSGNEISTDEVSSNGISENESISTDSEIGGTQ